MENASPQPLTQKLICERNETDCQFLNEIAALKREIIILTEQLRTDALTGLFNFRFFNETISLEMERARRGVQPLSMILLDIDHFKKFNDQWGHETGNHALIHISRLMKIAVRKLDYACRFGGEEFVILLPNTDLRQATYVAERLRDMIASTALVTADKGEIMLTASLGVDQLSTHASESSEAFIQRVDCWLYHAKHQGRNQVGHPDFAAPTHTESVTPEEKDALFTVLNNELDDK